MTWPIEVDDVLPVSLVECELVWVLSEAQEADELDAVEEEMDELEELSTE